MKNFIFSIQANNNERFFDFLTRIQGKRMDDQRAEMQVEDITDSSSIGNPNDNNIDANIENNNIADDHVDNIEDGNNLNHYPAPYLSSYDLLLFKKVSNMDARSPTCSQLASVFIAT